MYIDSHTHLNDENMFINYQAYIDNFLSIGGKVLINTGASDLFNSNGLIIANANKKIDNCKIVCTLGYHPHEIVEQKITVQNIDLYIQKIESSINKNKDIVVAIGETGIDLHYENSIGTIKLQQELFDRHCLLAQKLDLPIVVHSRDALDQTLEVLKKYKNLKIYFHCRGYDQDRIIEIQKYFSNLWVGFCGNITYKKAEDLRSSLDKLDINKLLIETDAPYLSPQELRGQINQPYNVMYIYDFISKHLNINLESLQKVVYDNCHRLFWGK